MHRYGGEGLEAGRRMVGDGGIGMHQPPQLQQSPQQQVAALLTAAAPASQQQDAVSGLGGASDDATTRAASLEALHRLLLQPHVLPALRRSLSRLCQSLQQLLGDKAFAVRQAAAVAYGAVGALSAALPLPGVGTGGRLAGPIGSAGVLPAERFLGWALPQLADRPLDGDAAVVALSGLQEFLTAGDASATEKYAASVFKACQEVLEDEGTSMTLVRPMLGLLAVLSLRFSRCFQPNFADVVDLLLGWALEPDFSESDRQLIAESFLRFQHLWVGSLRFSLSLLSKFLDDMEMLAQDAAPATSHQIRRLLALVCFFLAVLRATVSGVLEVGQVEEVVDPAKEMLPRFLACVTAVGRKYRDYKWTSEASKCLTVFAELLKGDFAPFYDMALEVILGALAVSSHQGSIRMQRGCVTGLAAAPAIALLTSSQVHSLLQVNMELMSHQGFDLSAAVVAKLIGQGSSFPRLRLHPNRLVAGSFSPTYLFLLQHSSPAVAAGAGKCVFEEMLSLKASLGSCPDVHVSADKERAGNNSNGKTGYIISDVERVALFKFDLMALVGSVCLGFESKKNLHGKASNNGLFGTDAVRLVDPQLSQLEELKARLVDELNPFEKPLQCYPDLQLALFRALHRLSRVQLGSQQRLFQDDLSGEVFGEKADADKGMCKLLPLAHYVPLCCFENSHVIAQGLSSHASVPVKLEALSWISSLCDFVVSLNSALIDTAVDLELPDEKSHGRRRGQGHMDGGLSPGASMPPKLLRMLLSAASDKELKVRERVAPVLEMLLQAELVDPSHVQAVSVVALEQLGDSEPAMQASYRKVLLAYAPAALWMCGWMTGNLGAGHGVVTDDRKPSDWKKLFAATPFAQHLRPQQLVCILNYVAQRWQVLPSHWLQRLVHNAPSYFRPSKTASEKVVREVDDSAVVENISLVAAAAGGDFDFLERACRSNDLAAYWWCIQEAARHCVTVRLRTHLGGPTQTFAALERMLLEVAQHLQSDTGQREGLGSTSTVRLLPMRLLLEFVEALKKNIYNAFDGCVVLPAATPPSALFFRANKKVCEEWFSRIREALMNACVGVQCHAGTVHQATWRLQDIRALMASVLREQAPRSQMSDNVANMKSKLQHDVCSVLRHASLALCRVHDADALVGLQTWASSTFGTLLIDDGSGLQRVCNPVGPFGWMQGLAFQARGQYEKASAHFAHLLQSEEAMGAMGADGVQFTIARAIESFVAINDWDSLDTWVQTLQMLRAKHAGKAYSGALTTAGNDMNAIHALARWDAGDVQGAWGYLDLTPQSSNELTADPRLALQRSEQMLLQAMMRPESKKDEALKEIGTAKAMLEEALQVAGLDGLSEAAAFVVQLDCIKTFEEGMNHNSFSEHSGVNNACPSAMFRVIMSPFETLHQDCALWLKLLRVHRSTYPCSQRTLQLQQQLVKLARKQGNFRLAHRLFPDFSLGNLQKVYVPSDEGWNSLKLGFEYESILLAYAEEKHEDAIKRLWSFVRDEISRALSSTSSVVVTVGGKSVKAKACLKLSRWLKQKTAHPAMSSLLLKIGSGTIYDVPSRETNVIQEGGELISYSLNLDEGVGAATKVATSICPDMATAWFSYACWCYEHAKSCFSGSRPVISKPSPFGELLHVDMDGSDSSLLEAEVTKLRSIITAAAAGYAAHESTGESEQVFHMSNERANLVEMLVQKIRHIMQAVAGAAGVEDSDGDSPAALLSLQLLDELKVLQLNVSQCMVIMAQLMSLWWALRRRRVVSFGHAARGFLQYLSMSHDQQRRGISERWFNQGKRERKDTTLLASLYVFRILSNYGVELEGSLQQGLATVPPSPWQAITAQLFARLSSHPEPKVRKQLLGLLMALANVSPWVIVYPTLVDFNAFEGNPSEELQHLLGCLRNLHSKLVRDVKVMIAELGSITVLWEEQWLSTLQDLHSDVTRRINTLKEEATRVAENPTLTHAEKVRINAAKYSAMMAPIAVALERRLASTSRPPATPHEIWFQEQFAGQLKSAIQVFKLPPAGAASLSDCWRPLDAIAASLANHQKKSVTVLADVSPLLAAVTSSEAPMPGLEVDPTVSSNSAGGGDIAGNVLPMIVTVAAFDEQVFILSTKTKPKKLSLVGSDGQRYTYLLKGREDLRLDARIMQLLHAVNGMLSARRNTRRQGLAVRHYSVTPISGRAGLIQWIDNLTSMYSVFKAWQQRTQAAQLATSAGGTNGFPAPSPVPRPSDMFYGKIIPALKEKGLRKVISRRDWPQEVKRKVLLELMKETPRQLLYKELWCSSEGITSFFSKLQRFSGSVAVMSMVGHILGLGDRHLDNILVDFSTGDVVHIDYNVCFDKGLRLKIPEIVPFRLTQTIQAALGLTGVEGTFRASCEAVLEALQKNKELIIMLLEVFVWDPLVEWMRGDGHDEATIGGEERKGMELAVSLSLFASRVQEIRVPLQEHHDHLLTTLPAATDSLRTLVETLDQFERLTAAATQADIKKSLAGKSEGASRSLMNEASTALEKARLNFEAQAREFAQAKALVSEAAREFTQWIEHHGRVLESLRSGAVPEVQAIGQLPSPAEALSLTSAVLAAGVPLTVVPEPAQVHCKDVDREVSQLTMARHEALLHAARSLRAYCLALQRLLPSNYLATSHVHMWAQVLQLTVRQLSPDVLAAARRQAAELVLRSSGEHDEAVRQKYEAVRMLVDQLVQESNKLQEELTVVEESVDPDAEKKAKDRVLGVFTRHLQGGGQWVKKDEESVQTSGGRTKLDELKEKEQETEEKRMKVIAVLQAASTTMFSKISERVSDLCSLKIVNGVTVVGPGSNEEDKFWCLPELLGQTQRCVLVSEIMTEIYQTVAQGTGSRSMTWWDPATSAFGEWAVRCQMCIVGVQHLVSQMVGVVLPEAIKAALSHDPAVMEAFASLSQIRGTVDTAVEQVAELEMQRSSLSELERSYPEKFDEISRRLASLEAAAMSGRDNLSWEEAEELASQEEACREMQDKLNRAWVQRGAQASALSRKGGSIRSALLSAEQRFESLVAIDRDADLHLMRGKVLLAAFAKLFFELQVFDQKLNAYRRESTSVPVLSSLDQLDCMVGGSMLASVWKVSNVLQDKTFFVWKVGMMDALLDACIRDAVPATDSTLSLEQVLGQQKKRLESQLQCFLDQYLKERVAVVLHDCLGRHKQLTLPSTSSGEDEKHVPRKDGEPVKRALKMLDEYCDVHETVGSAKAVAASIKGKMEELKQALHSAHIEAARLEWLHEAALSRIYSQSQLLGMPKSIATDVNSPTIAWWNRQQILDNFRSSVAGISRATDGLLACDAPGSSAEEQLDRAMAWACAGSSTPTSAGSSTGRNGIPPEFHDHLRRRRQLLWSGQEQASGIVRLCEAVMNFEASREGYLSTTPSSSGTLKERRDWQQTYSNLIQRLESACLSFSKCDLECQSAQKNIETASARLASAAAEYNVAASEAEVASVELQGVSAAVQNQMVHAGAAVTAFCRMLRTHSALTIESGSMLEEVLAITDGTAGANDVHSLAQEAAMEHSRMMSDLSKVSGMLVPLESVLITCCTAISDQAGTRELDKKTKGSYLATSLQSLKLREVLPSVMGVLPGLLGTVKLLHSTLTKLARTASSDAGVLHKALEGVGESQEARSQDVQGAPDSAEQDVEFPNDQHLPPLGAMLLDDEGSWISPPGSSPSDESGYLSNRSNLDQISQLVGHSQRASADLGASQILDFNVSKLVGSTSLYLAKLSVEEQQSGTAGSQAGGTAMVAGSATIDTGSDHSSVISSEVTSNTSTSQRGDIGQASAASQKFSADSAKTTRSLVALLPSATMSDLDKQSMVETHGGEQPKQKLSKRKISPASYNNSAFTSLPSPQIEQHSREKNAYAVSVVRRVRTKLEGRDMDGSRHLSVAEQVDYLLRQATSIDNLCNMYEGWTPWI